MADPIHVEPTPPIGTRRTIAHVNRGDQGSGFEELELPTYPPCPEGPEIRRARVAAGLTLGEAARALGISVVAMSGLERGSHRPVAPTTWEAVAKRFGELGEGGRDG